MNGELIQFYKNSKMADIAGLELLPRTVVSYGSFSHNNYVDCTVDDFQFRITGEDFVLFESRIACILVNDIMIYRDYKWIHKVPKEMKIKAKEALQVIVEYNEKCKASKLSKIYKRFLKEEQIRKKKEKKQEFENEREFLNKKFSSK